MKLFKRLFKALNDRSVQYMVAGGIAVNLYGIERATADTDIVLRLDEENIGRFITVAKELGLRPKVPVRLEEFADAARRRKWVTEKGMKVFSLYDPQNPFFLLDVFVEIPFDFDAVYRQRKQVALEETEISVVPLKALIAMKEGTDRPQDKTDVVYLKRIMEEWEDER